MNNYLSPQIIYTTKTTTYADGNADLDRGQAPKCGEVKLVNEIFIEVIQFL
jgi:hypothetical protein